MLHRHLQRAFLKRFPFTCLRTWCGCLLRCLSVSLQKSWLLQQTEEDIRWQHTTNGQISFAHSGHNTKVGVGAFFMNCTKVNEQYLLTVVLCSALYAARIGCSWTLLRHLVSRISSPEWTSAAPGGCTETRGHSGCIWSENNKLGDARGSI